MHASGGSAACGSVVSRPSSAILVALVSALAAACSSDGKPGEDLPALPWARQAFPEVIAPPDNPTTEEKSSLGRLLFYDPVLSSDQQIACATCHSELWGMGDGLPLSVGVGGGILSGPGRAGPNLTRRNSQTLWNTAFRESLFWDGRATSLEDQVHFPFDAIIELDRNMDDAVIELRTFPEYVRLFTAAFPGEAEPVTRGNLERAIAAFERTLITSRSLYDGYVDGDPLALGDASLRGMQLFADQGCASCHAPPLFSSDRFADRGVPPVAGVEDAGRFEVTGDEADRNLFKVPTLRNAQDTGPFFHTGSVETLGEAVRQEADFGASHGEGRPLTDDEISDVTTFILKGLFDLRHSPARPREVPSGLPVPLDGFNVAR